MLPLAANRRLVEHGSALDEEGPPQLAELLEGPGAKGFYAEAGVAKRFGCGVDGGAGFRGDRCETVVFEEADALSAEFVEGECAQRHGRAGRIGIILATQRFEHQLHVCHDPRHRADRAQS